MTYCKFAVLVIHVIGLVMVPQLSLGQETAKDKVKTMVTSQASDTIQSDTLKIIEDAPLDIAQNRGLFIVTPDKKMQLRILGSVRYLVVFDNVNLPSKNDLNTFQIPTPSSGQKIPNYYNGLDQSRLGFEITRSTPSGNVFIRLETDFAGSNGFRIRHAYGQINRFLLGQTWSLFSHINALPSMVDFSGPTGSVVERTPQIRFSAANLIGKINFAFGLEYFPPDLDIPDSLQIDAFQLIPDVTVRADRTFDWGSAQLSGILPVLSGRRGTDVALIPGWGLSASVVINLWASGKWYIQGVAGEAISRYFNDLGGNGFDIEFPSSGGYITPLTYGFYSTYEHSWTNKLYSNFTYSMVGLQQESSTVETTFKKGHTLRMNTFWDITDGAKIGGEFIWGNRINKNKISGDAVRINLLFYYDF